MSVKEYYARNTQYGRRAETDFQAIVPPAPRKYCGIMDSQALFIEENQLLCEEYWHLFTEQFKTMPDGADEGWRGEYFGKMMRGSSMTYQYTKNEELYELLQKIVLEMLETQDELGRFSTYKSDDEFKGWDMWCRKYVILGMLHFHEICKDEALRERIVSALCCHLDYIIGKVGEEEGKRTVGSTSGWWGGINSASILEPTVRMYNITGKKEYLDFAEHIINFLMTSEVNIFALALENKIMPYQYPVTKAYEMMSCFEGLIEYYRITGEEKWLTAAKNFAQSVKESDITVIGCAGCEHELFNHAVATQTDTDYEGIMQETCVTVTWMKLCTQLLLLTGDPKYADWIEVSLYNALYGAVNNQKITSNGGFMFDSYSPLTAGLRGRLVGGNKYLTPEKNYGCCVAIGAAGTALPLSLAVTEKAGGIVLNFYETGRVKIGGFTLDIITEYPAKNSVKIRVVSAPDEPREILVRIPGFSGKNTDIKVNGEVISAGVGPSYATISRKFASGDEIDILFDMNPRILRPCGVEGKPESKDFLAFVYGPLVLARDRRIGEVGTTVPAARSFTVKPTDKGDTPCLFRAEVTLSGSTFEVIDYGSAGKTWDDRSLCEAWIPCK